MKKYDRKMNAQRNIMYVTWTSPDQPKYIGGKWCVQVQAWRLQTHLGPMWPKTVVAESLNLPQCKKSVFDNQILKTCCLTLNNLSFGQDPFVNIGCDLWMIYFQLYSPLLSLISMVNVDIYLVVEYFCIAERGHKWAFTLWDTLPWQVFKMQERI